MAEEKRLKSAFELAMERLGAKGGASEGRPLSERQKEQIAAIRAEFKARRAEAAVLHDSAMAKALEAGNPETLANLARDHERETSRLAADEEARVAAVRDAGD